MNSEKPDRECNQVVNRASTVFENTTTETDQNTGLTGQQGFGGRAAIASAILGESKEGAGSLALEGRLKVVQSRRRPVTGGTSGTLGELGGPWGDLGGLGGTWGDLGGDLGGGLGGGTWGDLGGLDIC